MQPDLLGWEPSQAAFAFPEADIRAGTAAGRVARAVAATLKACPLTRREVARRMSDYIGAEVSLHMLDAYASQGRAEHHISAPRLLALLHATGDRRLLEALAAPFGFAVIERRYLADIEMAELREREGELRRRRKALARRIGGK
ncbi:phage regulatory CII family protein [Humitalea rosea]|nr:DNA transposition protein [Humitalea rosea]